MSKLTENEALKWLTDRGYEIAVGAHGWAVMGNHGMKVAGDYPKCVTAARRGVQVVQSADNSGMHPRWYIVQEPR